MKHLYLSLVATSPITIRADQAEGGSATAKHIPGTTLRGGLAAAHQMLYPKRDDEFIRLFLDEQISFPHLYPAHFKCSDVSLDTENLPVKPLPKTAQTCKRFPGFCPLDGEEAEERHGIRDSLLDWALFSLLDSEQQSIPAVLAPLEQHTKCTVRACQKAIDHTEGFYRCARHKPQQRMKAGGTTRLQTRTGINRKWGVVEEGILYNREVFDDGMKFWGELLFPDEDTLPEAERRITHFKNFLQEAILQDKEKPGIVRIGTGRTRGLGCIALAENGLCVKGREPMPTFQERLEKFDTTLRSAAKEMDVKKLDAFYFAITLTSPAILRDPFLRYQKTLDVATLGELLKPFRATFKPIYQAVGIQRLTGWNELWGTPRANDYALEMGSTFLFSSDKRDTELFERLYDLEETGIGLRRAEGFGRICISDPFHLEREQL